MGASSWWWGREPDEDPALYRSLDGRPSAGVEDWSVTSSSRAKIVIMEPGGDAEVVVFSGPLEGSVRFDLRDLDALEGGVQVPLSGFQSGTASYDEGWASFAGKLEAEGWPAVKLSPLSLSAGTAPRWSGDIIPVDLEVSVDISGHPVRVHGGFLIERSGADRVRLTPDEELSISLAALFPGLEIGRSIAGFLGVPDVHDYLGLGLELELERGARPQ